MITATVAGCATLDASSESTTTDTLTPVVTRSRTATDTSSTGADPTTDERTRTHYRRVSVHLTETDPEAIARAVLRGDEYLESFEADLINRTVADETTTYTSINYDVLSERLYVERDPGYFRITRSVAERETVTAHAFQLDAVTTCPGRTQSTPTNEDPVPLEELPATDRQVFLVGVRESYQSDACFSFSDRLVQYTDEARRRSVFVGESPTLVRHRDDTYLVTYEGTEQRTKRTFEFTAEPLGDRLETYAETVAPEVVWHVVPDELPARQRTLFERLLREEYYETEKPIPDAVLDFLREVESHAYSLEEFGPYFLRHDGTYHRLSYSDVMS